MEEKAEAGQGVKEPLPPLIFLGTPDFALPSLAALARAGAPVRLVVTQPDRPKGRGRKSSPPPVKVLAEELGLPVYQPPRLRDPGALERILSFQGECLAVVAYGQWLPSELLAAHPLGALNVHPSLLPKYRGPAPIQRALLSGDRETGVSIMLLDEGMDTGPVLRQVSVPVEEGDTFGSLHDKLAETGGSLLRETLRDWRAGRVEPAAQEDALAVYAPPVSKEELRLLWSHPARRIVDTVRAFDPWPGAYAVFQGKRIKCFQASLLSWKSEGRPGEVVGLMEEGLVVLGGDGRALAIGRLQKEGHRPLQAEAFWRGSSMSSGVWLE